MWVDVGCIAAGGVLHTGRVRSVGVLHREGPEEEDLHGEFGSHGLEGLLR